MKKIALSLLAFFCVSAATELSAQQLPDYTQYPSLLFAINPAYTGTKGNLDARLDYRKQWVGFDDAPVTQFAGLHSRLLKGRLGLGATVYKDMTGPSRRFDYGFSLAYHLHFPDVELSAGIGMNFMKYYLDGTKMTTHWTNDPAVDYALLSYDKQKNVSGGVLLYNDRFHFGLGVLNIINNKVEFANPSDTSKYSKVTLTGHYYFTAGYNFHGNPDYVWENNLMALYVNGLPLTINYNLRVHYKEKITGGIGWRLKDDIYLQGGYVFLERIQVLYSYDVGISHLRKGHSGTHEIMVGYRMDIGAHKGGYKNFQNFQRQKYNIF